MTIDGHLVVHVHAHDRQFDVRFDGHWQQRLKDDALDELFLDCQALMVNRRVGKGASKGE